MTHPPQSAANTFYTVAELRQLMLGELTFVDLVNISHVDSITRFNVLDIVKARVHASLQRWFENADIQTTLVLLRQTLSAISGLLPMQLMDLDLGALPVCGPERLDILIPKQQWDCWGTYLKSHGYQYESPDEIPLPVVDGVIDAVYRHVKRNAVIVVHISRTNDIMCAVVHMPTTLHMNIFTGSEFYSFYPRLSQRLVAIQGFWPVDSAACRDLFGYKVRIERTVDGINEPCYTACPNMWRRTFGLRHIGRFQWQEDADAQQEIKVHEQASYMWRLGDVCTNLHCERSFLVR